MLYLKNCSIIDCIKEDGVRQGTIVIKEGRIEDIIDKLDAGQAECEIIDLQHNYLLPGLWDMHTHPGGMIPDPTRHSMFEFPAERTIRAYNNIRNALLHGLTSLRVNGEADYIDVALKNAQINKELEIPRLFVAGKYIRATGGHGSYGKVEPLYIEEAIEADGPDEIKKAARTQLKMGADHLKLFLTGGIAGDKESMYETQLSFDEIKAAVEVAKNKGARVAVHAGGAEAVKTAIKAGVESIEHGYHLDDETVSLMADTGTFYVPTLSVTQDIEYISMTDWPEHMRQKAERGKQLHLESFQKALNAGVKIASGSDLNPIGPQGVGEVIQLVKAGMTPWQAIVAATRVAAELCYQEKKLGTIAEGKIADFIVVRKNPLEDIINLRNLCMVIQDGKVISNNISNKEKSYG